MSLSTKPFAAGRTPGYEAEVIFQHLDLWTEQGLITREEAAAIRDFEEAGGESRARRMGPMIQALLYMGTSLTLAALGTIYWQLYEDLSRPARVTTPALLAAILGAAGWFTARRTDPDIRRFGGVLWLLSTGAVAGSMSELVMPDELAGDWSLFLVGAVAAVWAGILVRSSAQATTQIGLLGSTMAAVVGVPLALTQGFASESDITWLAPSFALLGVAWIVGGRFQLLRPMALADVLGAALIIYAPTFLFGTGISEGIPLLAGSILAGGLLAASAWLRSTAMLAVGAVGLYAYSFRAIWVYFGDSIGTPVVLLIGGLLLLAMAFGFMRLAARRGR